MNAELLIKILEKIPGDYEIVFMKEDIEHGIDDRVEVDFSNEKLILK